MRHYLVTSMVYRRGQAQGDIEHFACRADDAEHAIEQARSHHVPHRVVIFSVVITH